jgi:hypothetical protein
MKLLCHVETLSLSKLRREYVLNAICERPDAAAGVMPDLQPDTPRRFA